MKKEELRGLSGGTMYQLEVILGIRHYTNQSLKAAFIFIAEVNWWIRNLF